MSTARKRELLLESDLNRQILLLELHQIQDRLRGIRGSLLHSPWRFAAPLAGVLIAWKFRGFKKFLTSGMGLLAIRKLWDALVAWSSADRTPVRR